MFRIEDCPVRIGETTGESNSGKKKIFSLSVLLGLETYRRMERILFSESQMSNGSVTGASCA